MNSYIMKPDDIEKRYECNNCQKSYKQKLYLEKHIEFSHKDNKFLCEHIDCNKIFKTKSSLRQHTINLHVDKKIICDQCQKAFSTNRCLKRHMRSVHFTANYTCEICSRVFKTNHHMKRHRDEVHNEVGYDCKICNEKIKTRYFLQLHLDTVHSLINYDCAQCSRSFKSRYFLGQHLNKLHKTFDCELCKKPFTSKQSLNSHKEKVHDSKLNTNKSIEKICPSEPVKGTKKSLKLQLKQKVIKKKSRRQKIDSVEINSVIGSEPDSLVKQEMNTELLCEQIMEVGDNFKIPDPQDDSMDPVVNIKSEQMDYSDESPKLKINPVVELKPDINTEQICKPIMGIGDDLEISDRDSEINPAMMVECLLSERPIRENVRINPAMMVECVLSETGSQLASDCN